MDTRLDSLAPIFKPLVFALLARLTEQRICVCIVNTRRTAIEQAAAVARGVSWTEHSKHQDGLAIDLCPYDIWSLHGDDKLQWNLNDLVWVRMAAVGKSLGLRCGIDFPPKNNLGVGKDPGHFEYVAPQGVQV